LRPDLIVLILEPEVMVVAAAVLVVAPVLVVPVSIMPRSMGTKVSDTCWLLQPTQCPERF